MIFRRPSFIYTLIVSCPSVLFYGTVAILFGPIDFLFFSHRRPGPVGLWVKTRWFGWMFRAHSLCLHVTGPGSKKLSEMKGCIFVSNHQSAIDILIQARLLPQNAHFIAKKELLWIPIFGYAARVVGTIFIDRLKGSRQKSLTHILDFLQRGDSLIIYPEGTRSRDGKLKTFKRGAFVMAIKAKAQIVPMTIFDSRFLCPKGRLSVEPGDIHVYVDEPIDASSYDFESRAELTDRVHSLIEKRLENWESPERDKVFDHFERT